MVRDDGGLRFGLAITVFVSAATVVWLRRLQLPFVGTLVAREWRVRSDRREGRVFITADQNLRYQQNLTPRQIATVELPTIWLPLIPALVPAIQQVLAIIVPGSYVQIPMP